MSYYKDGIELPFDIKQFPLVLEIDEKESYLIVIGLIRDMYEIINECPSIRDVMLLQPRIEKAQKHIEFIIKCIEVGQS